jgi:hypothetical protein
MKFFTNLPKRAYSTPIGTINLCDFYSFYNKKLDNKRQITIVIDNQTTLIEASLSAFNDPDSLWVFLHSNNKINPFELTKENATTYIAENEVKTSFNPISVTSGGYVPSGVTFNPPAGSILTSYLGSTSGNPWEYSYVGNFDLNGSFALVEKSNSYNTSTTVKPSFLKGDGEEGPIIYPSTTPITNLTFLYSGDTYFSTANNVTANNSIKYTDSTEKQVSTKNDKQIFTTRGGEKVDTVSNFIPSSVTGSNNITINQAITIDTKQINVISSLDLPSSLSTLVTPKYSGI